MAQNGTTLRCPAGATLYAKRSTTEQFMDVQADNRAHGSDVERRAKTELSQRTSWSRQDTARAPERGD